MAQRILFVVLLCVPLPGFARHVSHVYYLDIRGDEDVKRALLAQLTSRPCLEEADLHAIGTYETSKEHGGE